MSASFPFIEKVAVAGAFCALVAMAVGTESEPGVIAATKTQPGQTIASASQAAGAKLSANWWGLADRAPASHRGGSQPAPPPPEILPPGFGATPSPDLPQ